MIGRVYLRDPTRLSATRTYPSRPGCARSMLDRGKRSRCVTISTTRAMLPSLMSGRTSVHLLGESGLTATTTGTDSKVGSQSSERTASRAWGTWGRILIFAYASFLRTYANLVFLSPCVRKPSYVRKCWHSYLQRTQNRYSCLFCVRKRYPRALPRRSEN